jgi:hypothetical protein
MKLNNTILNNNPDGFYYYDFAGVENKFEVMDNLNVLNDFFKN